LTKDRGEALKRHVSHLLRIFVQSSSGSNGALETLDWSLFFWLCSHNRQSAFQKGVTLKNFQFHQVKIQASQGFRVQIFMIRTQTN
jgi:hypothetical protein